MLIDTYARSIHRACWGLIGACLCAFDIAAAFPSVSHEYLFACLAAADLPLGAITLIRLSYSGCDVVGGVC